jgi:hypothetical protein
LGEEREAKEHINEKELSLISERRLKKARVHQVQRQFSKDDLKGF